MSNVIRIIVGGEGRIGFLRMLKLSNKISMTTTNQNGEKFDFYSNLIDIENEPHRLSIWEFTEKQKWKSLLDPFIKGANGAILVFEINRISLYKYIKNWVNLFRKFNSNLPIILVGTIPNINEIRRV